MHPLSQRRKGRTRAYKLRLEPAGAEPEDAAPTRDVVDRRDLLGEDGRISEVGWCDERAELDVFGDRSHGRELGPGLEDGQVRQGHAVHVVAHPDGIEAEQVELECSVSCLLPGPFDLWQRDSEANGSTHR